MLLSLPWPAHPILTPRGFTINFTQWPWGVYLCERAHFWGCVYAPLWLFCIPVDVDLTSFWHGASCQARVEGKSFVGALEMSDSLEPSLGPGGREPWSSGSLFRALLCRCLARFQMPESNCSLSFSTNV